jgi:tetratricopeptide (TPR) repeat protein
MPEPSAAPPGLPNRYRILQRLGSGGMGDVYAAIDETLQRRVALKAIQAGRRLNTEAQERFLREARILSQLDHPNISRAYDYIRGDESDWLVMELVEGWTLGDLIARKQMTDAEITKISEQIAQVLVVTHAAGIVHRDLKPGNVMITPAGDAKVLDFGIARSGGARPLAAPPALALAPTGGTDTTINLDVTRTSDFLPTADAAETLFRTRQDSTPGTLAYMSPEQARGDTASSASDMFAFGLLLQEMLTRRRAYDTSDRGTLVERVQNGVTVPIEGSSALVQLVRQLTSGAASQRPTAIEAVARLRWIRDTPKRRLRRTIAIAAVLAVVLAGVKYTMDLRRERTAALAAEEDANRRRGQAEGLIGFMLDDLRLKLEKVGRVDLLDDVGAQSMKYFGSVPASSLTNEELSRRAQALYQIGVVRQTQGNLKDARAAYDESLAAAKMVAARDPGNADFQLRLGTAHFYAGDVRRRENDLSGAMREFSAYRDIADTLVTRDGQNQTWRLESSYGYSNVAAIQELQGDLDGARKNLEVALSIKSDISKRDPKNAARLKDVANAHNRLGVVLDRMGETTTAIEHYADDLAIRRALAAAEPGDQTLKRPMFVALITVGDARMEGGDLAAAMSAFDEAFALMAPLAASDPKNTNWRRDLGVIQRASADALRELGRSADARARYDQARTILSPLAAAAPTDVNRQRDIAKVEVGSGVLELSRGRVAAARAAADAAERLLAIFFQKKPDADTAKVVAEGRLLAADAAQRAGDATGAATLREAALSAARGVPGTRNKRVRAVEARALIALGRIAEAKPIVTELWQEGYRHPVLVREWKAKGGVLDSALSSKSR